MIVETITVESIIDKDTAAVMAAGPTPSIALFG
jgi:hypothetical protein